MILSCHSVHEVVINVACLLNIQAFTGALARSGEQVIQHKTSEPVPVLFVRGMFRHFVSTNWLAHMAHN